MKDRLELRAKKDYEKLSKEIKELYILDDFIKEVKKKWSEQKWQD